MEQLFLPFISPTVQVPALFH